MTTICTIARTIGLEAYGKLQEEAFASMPPEMIARDLFPSANVITRNWKVYDNFIAAGGTQPDLAPLLLPVGLVTLDENAVLGRDGYAFLTEGSNALLSQYWEDPNAARVADCQKQWIGLIADRKARLDAMGITYLQTFIPEKLSVIPEFFPSPITTPTPLLNAVEHAIADNPGLQKIYLSALDLYTNANNRPSLFRKIDTHIAPCGAFLLFAAIVERLGCPSGLQPSFTVKTPAYADIGSRFLRINVFDELLEADPTTVFSDRVRPSLIEQFSPADGSHGGKREVWVNPGAKSDATIVVFGNSFVEFVERGQFALSWWFCRHFRHYHFIWSAEVIWDYVESLKPDYVLCQGIERFMMQVPPE